MKSSASLATQPGPIESGVKSQAPARAPAHPQLVESDVDTRALVEQLRTLRQRGQFDDAAAMLKAALERPLGPESRERLSYELGSLLTYHGADHTKACAHWARHDELFPKGRYGREVAQARRVLGCPLDAKGAQP
jgi:transmembrane sensor